VGNGRKRELEVVGFRQKLAVMVNSILGEFNHILKKKNILLKKHRIRLLEYVKSLLFYLN
jgi:hypothetical protein